MGSSRDQVAIDEWVNTNHRNLHDHNVSSRNDRVNRVWLYKVVVLVVALVAGACAFLR